jgi:uncharacterized protein YjbJ (UPF0337 family)
MSIPNNDEVEGKYDRTVGTVKDKVGEAIGDRDLEAEGEAQNAEGKGEEAWGKLKRGVGDAVDAVGDAVKNTGDKINR